MVLNICVNYDSTEELYRAVEEQIELSTGTPVKITRAVLRQADLEESIRQGNYEPKHSPGLTVEEIAERWNCSANCVRNLIKLGRLVGFKAGKRYYVTESNVKKYEGE